MKKSTWRKQHKWFSLVLCFFLLMFCVSGIILNHRSTYSRVNVSRALLPHYQYKNWNSGLLRGTLPLDSTSTLIYGRSGIWQHSKGKITDYNTGLPEYADYRIIQHVVSTPDSTLFAAGQYGLYRRGVTETAWQSVSIPQIERERLSDVACKGDTLVVLSRDNIYMSLPPYNDFKTVTPGAPEGYEGRVSLFRVVWLIHNGGMFGIVGRVVLDLIALIMIALCVTGILYWIGPKMLHRRMRKNKQDENRNDNHLGCQNLQRMIKFNLRWHKRIGVWTFVILLLVVLTGWCLRPPLLIPLALNDVPAIPGTPVAKECVWDDKLRAIRYDSAQNDWILTTSDGFYSLPANLQGTPKPIEGAPHVSVMGVNVLQQDDNGNWLVGSLSGMWRWNRSTNQVTDYFTAEPMPEKAGPPFGKTPVSGYTADLGKPIIVEYDNGTAEIPQPAELSTLPMSLWQVALETHTGRIYHLFGLAPVIWIFLIGLTALWSLITGWKLRK